MTRSKAIALLLPLAFAACGGDSETRANASMAVAADTAVKPLVREPLTEADLVGLTMANLSIELPWTTNRVDRNPAPNAPRALLLSAEVVSHDGFDRLTLTFADDAPAPGYNIDVLDAGTMVPCGEEEDAEAVGVAGEAVMHLVLRPARVREDGRTTVPLRTTNHAMPRVHEAGVVCDASQTVTWMSGLNAASQIRVLEMRSPSRLIVDVR